jgi:hypothetical protein
VSGKRGTDIHVLSEVESIKNPPLLQEGRGTKEFVGYLDCGTSGISEVGSHPHAWILQAETLSQLRQADGPNPDRPVGGVGDFLEGHNFPFQTHPVG